MKTKVMTDVWYAVVSSVLSPVMRRTGYPEVIRIGSEVQIVNINTLSDFFKDSIDNLKK